MDISISTWMMIAFILGLILSIWKMWPFLVNKTLEDDDRGEDVEQYLQDIMLSVIRERQGDLDEEELFIRMTHDEWFDSKLLWRFNRNRLKQLLQKYYIQHPEAQNSIEGIYKEYIANFFQKH